MEEKGLLRSEKGDYKVIRGDQLDLESVYISLFFGYKGKIELVIWERTKQHYSTVYLYNKRLKSSSFTQSRV